MSDTTQKADPRYEVRAVKLKKDKKTEKFIPEIIIHDAERKRDVTFGECKQFAHDTFVNAVLALQGHYAVFLKWIEPDEINTVSLKDEEENPYRVRGFSTAGAQNELRITLKGHRILDHASPAIINVNNIYLNRKVSETDVDDGYQHLADLSKKIDAIKVRAMAYAFENEQWIDPALSMLNVPGFIDGNGATKAQIAEPVTPESVVSDIVKTTNQRPAPQSADLPDGKNPTPRAPGTPRKQK